MSSSGTPLELRLEDGTTMAGTGFGAIRPVGGEVVFCTAMTGYVEALTDPSYRGQIVVLTWPTIGSYGVPPARPAGSIDGPFESSRLQIQGLVVHREIPRPSHHSSERTLARWLADEGVCGISGIDTRALTIHLRERGTMRGSIVSPGAPTTDLDEVDMPSVTRLVAPASVVRHEGGERTVLVVDAGAKDNLVRSFLTRGTSVIRAPWTADIVALAREADGVVIGSGPGDPTHCGPLIEATRTLLGSFPGPIFGVCLGNQILSLAAGARTTKLPYGHRGVNQPVQDLLTRRCFMTSQNHGYAVDDASLPAGFETWFTNLNDGTNEGMRSTSRPHFSVQFHPESHPGPDDTGWLFDDFVRLVHTHRSTA